MKKFFIILFLVVALGFTAEFASRITPVSTFGNCAENQIAYNMTTHALAICTNTGYKTLAPTASPTFTGIVTIPTPFTLGATSVTTTGTQLNYLNAATGTTGTTSTSIVFSTSPSLTTPSLDVADAISVKYTGGSFVTASGFGKIYRDATSGLIIYGQGSSTDVLLANKNGGTVFSVATGTVNISFAGHLTVEGVTSTGATGTNKFVFDTSPTLVTPTLGVATATTINGNTFTTGTYTLTGVAGKTLTFNKTLTFDGTDSTTMTFPSTSATIARTDAANTFTGHQTIEGVTSTGATGTGKFVFDAAPTLSGAVTFSSRIEFPTSVSFPGTVTDRGIFYYSSVGGLTMYGKGSVYDVNFANASGATAIGIATGTVNLDIPGTITVSGAINYAVDAQATDTYVVTLSPAASAYTAGMYISFKANTANTGACTVNVNGLGAKSLKRGVNTDPTDNFIKSGSIVMAIYDGTNFQMIQPAAQ